MEITQNTILQLIVRSGPNTERKFIVPKSGELIYTVDTERLFVGNGVLSGGNITGNKFWGETTDPTTLYSAQKNDTVFDSDKKDLLYLKNDNPTTLSSWGVIGSIYISNSPNITITEDNQIQFNTREILAVYDGINDNLNYSKNLTNVVKISSGHYRFNYSSLSTTNIYPVVQILGLSSIEFIPRVINITETNCDVKIINSIPEYALAIDGVNILPTIDAKLTISLKY